MANGTLKVSNIQTSSGSGTITLGQSGETVDFSNATTTLNSAMKNTPGFFAYLGSDQTGLTENTYTLVACASEDHDTDGAYDTSTYKFTPQVAGKYYIYGSVRAQESSGNTNQVEMAIYKNGSATNAGFATIDDRNNPGADTTTQISQAIDMNGSSDYVQIYCKVENVSGATTGFMGSGTYFGGYKLTG
jgi:hypothetical protein